jgi:hypothetical protein
LDINDNACENYSIHQTLVQFSKFVSSLEVLILIIVMFLLVIAVMVPPSHCAGVFFPIAIFLVFSLITMLLVFFSIVMLLFFFWLL